MTIHPVGPTEQLLYSTVLIRVETADGGGTGTGFFFCFEYDDNRSAKVIITNKHVVRGAIRGEFRFHLGTIDQGKFVPTGDSAKFKFDKFEDSWFNHPDPEIDLCAVPVGPLLEYAANQGQQIFHVYLDDSIVPSQDELEKFDAVEDVVFVGYPIGLWDSVNNFPIFRRGVTATHPAVDYEGRSTIIIDAACYPGSSGSPVLIINKGMYTEKEGKTHLGSNRLILLGVLASGPTYSVEGKVVEQEIPIVQQGVAKTELMINLGFIVKSREIVALGKAMKEHYRKREGSDTATEAKDG